MSDKPILCRKCGGLMEEGIALKAIGLHFVHSDFSGDYEGLDVNKAQRADDFVPSSWSC